MGTHPTLRVVIFVGVARVKLLVDAVVIPMVVEPVLVLVLVLIVPVFRIRLFVRKLSDIP